MRSTKRKTKKRRNEKRNRNETERNKIMIIEVCLYEIYTRLNEYIIRKYSIS